ncbi:hypothetical protein [Dactylosporangium sp. NPDC051541]|uniref:hypothetical protein n=1 Tax=Dactylosporangium sp. NPDC051541 TaxID=3363977 RepID=UPI003796F1AB
MSDNPRAAVTLRPRREDDLPTMFDVQFDEEAQRQAAFVGPDRRDREAYYAKFRKIVADDAIVKRVVEVGGEEGFADARQETVTEPIHRLG